MTAAQWFAQTYKGAPTDTKALLEAAWDAATKAERERCEAVCASLTKSWVEPLAVAAAEWIAIGINGESK